MYKMRKPIFIVKAPNGMDNIDSQNYYNALNIQLKEDYHLILVKSEKDVFEFEMYSSEKIEPIEIETLKEKLFEK